MTSTASEEIEKRFQGILETFGISGWIVVWNPDHTKNSRGQILPKTKTILIHDEEPEAARDTLIHEILELKLRPMLKPYRSLVNSLIAWADSQVYIEKEKAIENIIPLIIKFDEKDQTLKEVNPEK